LKKNTPKSSILSEKWTLQCWPQRMSQLFFNDYGFFSFSGIGGHVQNFEGTYIVGE
jgi:hypothetical protein